MVDLQPSSLSTALSLGICKATLTLVTGLDFVNCVGRKRLPFFFATCPRTYGGWRSGFRI